MPIFFKKKFYFFKIYDSYKRLEGDKPFNYDHLSGSEIVYYPTRNEFRVWNHS